MFAVKLSLISVFTLASCAIEDTTETDTDVAEQAIGCPSWGCNDNSPVMGPYSFWEGNLRGLPNLQGIRFGKFVIGTVPYTPTVVADQLRASHPVFGTKVGAQLTNGYFEVITVTGTYKIRVLNVHPKGMSPVTFWTGPASQVETYELAFEYPNGTMGDRLCQNPPEQDAHDSTGATWNAPLEAILFTGDRYDAQTRTVRDIKPQTTRDWFNIACAGSSLAKLHLNRHTSASVTLGYFAPLQARQAMLKMYASDICGSGKVFTHKGVPLHWANSPGWKQLTGMEFAFEAVWDDKGAQCLDTHRLGALYANQITAHCAAVNHPLPPCGGSLTAPVYPAGAWLVTAVPDPI